MSEQEQGAALRAGLSQVDPLRVSPPDGASIPSAGEAWISVEDGLPGEQGWDSRDVLVFLNGHCTLTDFDCRAGGGHGIRIGFYDADIRCFRVNGRPESFVTHWMDLPPAPAIEARSAETQSGSVEDESAITEGEAPISTPTPQETARVED